MTLMRALLEIGVVHCDRSGDAYGSGLDVPDSRRFAPPCRQRAADLPAQMERVLA